MSPLLPEEEELVALVPLELALGLVLGLEEVPLDVLVPESAHAD